MQDRGSGWIYYVKFDIKHIKGKENKVDDVLSRKIHACGIYQH